MNFYEVNMLYAEHSMFKYKVSAENIIVAINLVKNKAESNLLSRGFDISVIGELKIILIATDIEILKEGG